MRAIWNVLAILALANLVTSVALIVHILSHA